MRGLWLLLIVGLLAGCATSYPKFVKIDREDAHDLKEEVRVLTHDVVTQAKREGCDPTPIPAPAPTIVSPAMCGHLTILVAALQRANDRLGQAFREPGDVFDLRALVDLLKQLTDLYRQFPFPIPAKR